MSVRIGQLTDIHVADFSDLRARDFATKRITGWANYRFERAEEYDSDILAAAVDKLVQERPDLVLVTGDLTNLGLRSELRAALVTLAPLREANIRTLVIPGNHDAYLRSASNGQFERTTAAWQRADERVGEAAYPFSVNVGPDVAVVCFNSGVPTLPIMASGVVDDAQIGRGRELCDRAAREGRTLVFAVHHHPTRAPHKKREWTRGLRNVHAFRALAKQRGARLVLHGHNHFDHSRRVRGAERVCISGLSSSTTARAEPPQRVGQVGLYEVGEQVRIGRADWDHAASAFSDWRWCDVDEVPVETAREAFEE